MIEKSVVCVAVNIDIH